MELRPTSFAPHRRSRASDEWLRLHAPSDSRTDPAIDGKPPDRTCVRHAVTMSLAANNDADDAARPLF